MTDYWARYPVRKSYYVHRCKVCGNAIPKGDRYVDGGEIFRRAHVLCASGRCRYATKEEARAAGERMIAKHRGALEKLALND